MKQKILELRNNIKQKECSVSDIIREKTSQLRKEIREHETELQQLKITAIGDKYNNHIVFGSWDCPNSPTGECVYDSEKDPCLDDCIYCGGPDERK